MKTVKILHLYPNELNLYGDNGNIKCLYNRLVWRGYRCEINTVDIGEELNDDFDIMFIGGGQDREMSLLCNDINRKKNIIKFLVEQNKTILAICGGYQILGNYYLTANNSQMDLTGAIDFYTKATNKRMIGNMVFNTEFGEVVGFENHSGKTYLGKNIKPLGKVKKGCGNNGEDKTEGVMYNNTFCTYSHGPVLPKNPHFADKIISCATNENELLDIPDNIENMCHDSLIKKFLYNCKK